MGRYGRLMLVGVVAATLLLFAVGPLAAQTLRTPGYAGITRPIATQPGSGPAPAALGAGTRPDLLVDAAGTAHIVWTDAASGEPSRTIYCRVPRGASACQVTHALIPPGSDQFSGDLAGPAISAVNDQVVVLSHRYPQQFQRPDGTTGSGVVWMWTSDDGGESFSTPAMVASGRGPNTAVAGDVRGGAVAFGRPEAPSIAVASDTVTGGVTVTTIEPGRYIPLGAAIAPGDYVAARLAVVDGRPIVVYRDISGNGFIRRWSGSGNPNDAATWSPQEPLPGFNPEPTVAGGRLLVALTDRLSGGTISVADLTRGGPPVAINPGGGTSDHGIVGLPDGRAVISWRGRNGDLGTGTWLRTFTGAGRAGDPPAMIGPEGLFGRLGATADGGGMAVSEANGGGIQLSRFGSRLATGLPGLGSRQGGGVPGGGGPLPPDTVVDCQQIRFGAVEALLQDGCFLNAATGQAKVSVGTVRLNGLEIVPDAGVQVIINARTRTVDTTGTVSVLLRAPGIPEITLFRGRLNLKLSAVRAGLPLFEFPSSLFRPNILGFPVGGDVRVLLTDRGVTIPINLTLPAAFGGVSGATTLRADNARGLVVDSLEFRADGVPLGVATMRRLHVQYKADGGTSVGDCLRPPTAGASAQPDEWAGVFELQLPPPTGGPALCGSVRFGQGAFRAATFNIDLPPPGIVLFPGASITALGGGLALQPTKVDASARIGVIAASAGSSLVTIDGRISATFGAPFTLRGDAAVSAAGVGIGRGTFVMSTDGYVGLRLTAGPTIGPVRVNAAINGFVDGPRREFSLSGRGDVCITGACLDGGGAVVSTRGIAACLPVPAVPRGAGYRWGEPVIGGVSIWLTSCDMADYEVSDTRAPQLVAHQLGGQSLPVAIAGGAPTVDLRVRGQGGVPVVEVRDPAGNPVTPIATVADEESQTLYLALRAPRAGSWTVQSAAGSPPLTEIATARQVRPASVGGARVQGVGRGMRTLRYRARIGRDQSITYVERGRAGSRVLGSATAGAGSLRFRPGPGAGGRREIVALIAQGGLVRSERVVARYVAPPPAPVARARQLRVRRAGARALATWRPGAGAAVQRVQVRVSDGRRFNRQLRPAARRLTIARIGRGDRVTVTVTGQARDGRLGRPVSLTTRMR